MDKGKVLGKILEKLFVITPKAKQGINWPAVGFAVLTGASVALLLMSLFCPAAPPAGVTGDTLSVLGWELEGETATVKLPKTKGRAEPTVIERWRTVYPIRLPEWRVAAVTYRDNVLRLTALKREDDSTEILSATYFAPCGFVLSVTDSIRVDTFACPHRFIEVRRPRKWIDLSALTEWDSQDGFSGGAELGFWDSRVRLQVLGGLTKGARELGMETWTGEDAPWVRVRIQTTFF